jgi:transposase-like protein
LSALAETRDRVKVSSRSWPLEEKRRIVEEAFRPGMSVADVARRHGLHSSQVFNWQKVFGTRPTAETSGASSSVQQTQPDALPAGAPDGFLSIGAIVEPKDEGAVPRLNSSALLVGRAPQDRGADARPAMDERRRPMAVG